MQNPSSKITDQTSVEAQKEVMDYAMQQSFRYSIKTFLIMLPVMLFVILGMILFAHKILLPFLFK